MDKKTEIPTTKILSTLAKKAEKVQAEYNSKKSAIEEKSSNERSKSAGRDRKKKSGKGVADDLGTSNSQARSTESNGIKIPSKIANFYLTDKLEIKSNDSNDVSDENGSQCDQSTERKKLNSENNRKRNSPKSELSLKQTSKTPLPNEMLTCPHCLKKLTSAKRLQNHLEKNACQSVSKKSAPESSNSSVSVSPKGKTLRNSNAAINEKSNEENVQFNSADGSTNKSTPKRQVRWKLNPDRICTYCTKKFSTDAYYEYHCSQKVCMMEQKKYITKFGVAPFGPLKHGSRFVTKFGVVEVIVDDRIPSQHHEHVVTHKNMKRCQNAVAKEQSFNEKKDAIMRVIAAGTKERRQHLNQMYSAKITNSTNNSILQKSVWDLYCKSLTPVQILDERLSWSCKNRDPLDGFEFEQPNVSKHLEPYDSYPDRIVVCKLIPDERKVFASIDDVVGDSEMLEEEGSDSETYSQSVATVDSINQTKLKNKGPTIHLYINRRELIHKYDSLQAKYVCSDCGENFSSINQWRVHHRNKVCSLMNIEAQSQRRERVECAENAVANGYNGDKFLSILHAPVSPKVKIKEVTPSGAKRGVQWGNPHNVKEFKKHKWPPWMVFNVERSSIYPEVFISLGFKRGANNTKFFVRQAQEEGYINAHEKHRARKNIKRRKRIDERKASGVPSLSGRSKTTRNHSKQICDYNSHTLLLGSNVENRTIPNYDNLPELPPVDCNVSIGSLDNLVDGPNAHTSGSLLPANDPSIQYPSLPEYDRAVAPPSSFGMLRNAVIPDGNSPSNPIMHEQQPQPQPVTGYKTAVAPSHHGGLRHADNHLTANKGAKHSANSFTSDKSLAEEAMDAIAYAKSLAAAFEAKYTTIDATNPSDACSTVAPGKKRRKLNSQLSGISDEGKEYTLEDLDLKPKKPPLVVDAQALAEECEAGRYPSISRFNGDHEGECVLCRKADIYPDAYNPMIECDFCKNTAHQFCIDRKLLQRDPPVVTRESEPHDSLMCHDCISLCLNRRVRAEARRLAKWHHELSKTGLGQDNGALATARRRRKRGHDAASLEEEVNLEEVEDNSNIIDENINDDAPTYKPCSRGGPGGLICCASCAASYSRTLSNTAKEIEAQSVAKIGQEVNEILELLTDAKRRLRNTTDVSHANAFRRSLFQGTECKAKKSSCSRRSLLGLNF
ncbi:hypothetical protein ACHAXS_008449 [Conticribra weissflogii]